MYSTGGRRTPNYSGSPNWSPNTSFTTQNSSAVYSKHSDTNRSGGSSNGAEAATEGLNQTLIQAPNNLEAAIARLRGTLNLGAAKHPALVQFKCEILDQVRAFTQLIVQDGDMVVRSLNAFMDNFTYLSFEQFKRSVAIIAQEAHEHLETLQRVKGSCTEFRTDLRRCKDMKLEEVKQACEAAERNLQSFAPEYAVKAPRYDAKVANYVTAQNAGQAGMLAGIAAAPFDFGITFFTSLTTWAIATRRQLHNQERRGEMEQKMSVLRNCVEEAQQVAQNVEEAIVPVIDIYEESMVSIANFFTWLYEEHRKFTDRTGRFRDGAAEKDFIILQNMAPNISKACMAFHTRMSNVTVSIQSIAYYNDDRSMSAPIGGYEPPRAYGYQGNQGSMSADASQVDGSGRYGGSSSRASSSSQRGAPTYSPAPYPPAQYPVQYPAQNQAQYQAQYPVQYPVQYPGNQFQALYQAQNPWG